MCWKWCVETVHYQMPFSHTTDCTLEQGQILCLSPLLLKSEAEERRAFRRLPLPHRHGGARPRGASTASCHPPVSSSPAAHGARAPSHTLAMEIDYTAEVRVKNKGRSICVRAKWTASRRSSRRVPRRRHSSRGRPLQQTQGRSAGFAPLDPRSAARRL